MSINRIQSWLAWGATLLMISVAAAQELPEDEYVPYVDDAQIFDRADLSEYGNGPPRPSGWFLKVDHLRAAVSAPERTTIGKEGFNPLASDGAGFFIQTNDWDTGFISSTFESGERLEIGFVEEGFGFFIGTTVLQTNTHRLSGSDVGVAFASPFVNGVSMLEAFVDLNADGFDDDLNFNNVFGRDGIDLGTPNANPPPAFIPPFDGIPDAPFPTDFGDLVSLPVYFQSAFARHSTSAWGIEAMRLWQLGRGRRNGLWETFAGARYFSFQDDFLFRGVGEVHVITINAVPTDVITGVLADTALSTRAENNIVGPQVGVRWTNRRGRLTFSSEGRVMAGANFQSIRQNGYIANRRRSITRVNPILPAPFNPNFVADAINLREIAVQDTVHDTEFSPVGEGRFALHYQLFRSVSFGVGWTGTYMTGIARSPNMVDYTLPQAGILEENNTQDVFIHSFDFSLNINR